jgi:glycosyltransferase involved in cell wall biosynthesis
MSTVLLSLVVPVYNVAAWLPACLDSLSAQTRPVDEIIVVDDGSTDECPAILAAYASRLPQMKVVRQENGGLSAARNTGLAMASGRYLAFLDSDDFVAPDMYRHLLDMVQADDLDIALCNADYHFEGREADRPIYSDVTASGVVRGSDWLADRLRQRRLMHMVWMHLYRRDFLTDNGFRFVPGLVHEDVIWTTQVLLRAGRVRYDPVSLYRYRIVQRTFDEAQNKRRLERIIASSVVNARTLAAFAVQETTDPALGKLVRWQAVDGAFSIFHKIGKVADRYWQDERYRDVMREGLFPLLWRNAVDWQQKRRIARNYLRALLAGMRRRETTDAGT